MTDIKKPVLPHGWIVKQSSSYPDRVYYFNINTGNSTWEPPTLQPEAKKKSCLSKPTASRQDGVKKSVSIATEPRFSPDIDTVTAEGSEDDLFDLNDDAEAAKGHQYHMEILQGFDSPIHNAAGLDEKRSDVRPFANENLRTNKGQNCSSSSMLYNQSACLQDVDMRPKIPNASSFSKVSSNHSSMETIRTSLHHYTNSTQKQSTYSPFSVGTVIMPRTCQDLQLPDSYDSCGMIQDQITPNNSFIGSRVPHTPSDHPSFSYSQNDLSSSFQTLPSVHSNLLPGYQKFSSTPIEKRGISAHPDTGLRSSLNNVIDGPNTHYKSSQDNLVDEDFRITKQNENYNNAQFKSDGTKEERKRRLSDLWESKKEIKKLKQENSNISESVDKKLCGHSTEKTKILSANDLRHKVRQKEGKNTTNTNTDKETVKKETQKSDPRLSKVKQKCLDSSNETSINTNRLKITKEIKEFVSDVRRVVSRSNCTKLEDITVQANSSTKNLKDIVQVNDLDNKLSVPVIDPDNTDSVPVIDPDKLLSIQTWIDNLQPDPYTDDEDSKRTSPDSGIISITCSTDSENRRIIVAGEKCGQSQQTVDSGFSSDSNVVFQPLLDSQPWQPLPLLVHPPNTCWRGVHSQGAVVNHNRDVMDMEIDDVQKKLNKEDDDRAVEDMEVVDIVVKEVRKSLKNRFTEVMGMLTEMVSSDIHGASSNHKGLYIVVDTNVLIDHLNFIEDLRDTHLPVQGKPVLVFPWVVLQELDYLKTGKTASLTMSLTTAKKARDAVQFLYQCLQSSHPRVVGQTPSQANIASSEFVAESNDDRILQCCLQCQNNNQGCLVVLLTNDRNLSNKSVIMGVKAYTQQNILSELSKLEGFVTPLKQKNRIADKTITAKAEQGKLRKSDATVEISGQNLPLENDENCLDDVYCKVKSIIKEAFSIILEREMKSVYTDIWLSIVYRKPPWSLRDVLECFKKHWIAVFGQIYNRRLIKSVEKLLDKIFKVYTVKRSDIEEVISEAVVLLNEDLKHKSYNNGSSKFLKELVDLKSCHFSSKVPEKSDMKSPMHRCHIPSVGNERKSPIYGTMKSPILSPQKHVFLKSEIKLQQIWQTVHNFCIELKEVAASSDSPTRRVYAMCDKLIPAVKDLQYHYSLALNIPPSETRLQLGNVIGLCDHLNNFLDSVEIEDTEGPIETFDLLDLFAAEDKRTILEKGHIQLKEMIKDIYTCVQQLPDECD